MPLSRQSPSYQDRTTRTLHGDEAYVLHAYQDHATSCSRCFNPLESVFLCAQGVSLAKSLLRYIYRRQEQFYASRSHHGDKTDRLHIPPHAYSVRWLLEAVEQGLHRNTTGEQSAGAADLRDPSIRIIEPQLHRSTPTHFLQIRPLCRRKARVYLKHSSHFQAPGRSPSGLGVRLRCNSRRSTVQIELKFHPD